MRVRVHVLPPSRVIAITSSQSAPRPPPTYAIHTTWRTSSTAIAGAAKYVGSLSSRPLTTIGAPPFTAYSIACIAEPYAPCTPPWIVTTCKYPARSTAASPTLPRATANAGSNVAPLSRDLRARSPMAAPPNSTYTFAPLLASIGLAVQSPQSSETTPTVETRTSVVVRHATSLPAIAGASAPSASTRSRIATLAPVSNATSLPAAAGARPRATTSANSKLASIAGPTVGHCRGTIAARFGSVHACQTGSQV